jgi:hypothetical protein
LRYVTAGDPDQAASREILLALERGGADVIEVGVPFSDPIADGRRFSAPPNGRLAAGGNLARTLDLVADVRRTLTAPIVLFTYVNPILRMGAAEFVNRAAAAGVDGVLLLDLPIEESGEMSEALRARDIDQIFLVSPTTTDARLARAARLGGIPVCDFPSGRDRGEGQCRHIGGAAGRAPALGRRRCQSPWDSASVNRSTCARSVTSPMPPSWEAPSCR